MISVARFRMLFILPTHAIWLSAFNCSVTRSAIAICLVSRSNIFLSLSINIRKIDVQFAACQQIGVEYFAVIFQIAKMTLSPYPDWLLIFLRLIISGYNLIVTDQLIFQPCAFIYNVLFHKNSLLKSL